MSADWSAYRIAVVGAGRVRGQIAMAGCPGRSAGVVLPSNSAWRLQRDVATLKHWGAQALVTLLDKQELAWLRLGQLSELLSSHNIAWHPLPLRQDSIPDERFEASWLAMAPRVRSILWCGGRVAVHCADGRSRTALITAKLLVELGCPPQDAINRVRAARQGVLAREEEQQFVQRQAHAPEAAYRTRLSLVQPLGGSRDPDATMEAVGEPGDPDNGQLDLIQVT
jgi:protein-tyrosine phosphatase